MTEKNPRDMLNKASWSLMEVIRDAVATNVTTAARNKQLAIDPKELPRLLAILAASVEEGYNRGAKGFDKTVGAALAATTPEVAAYEQLQETIANDPGRFAAKKNQGARR